MAKVFITPQAQREYQKLPRRERIKIRQKLTELEENPLAGKKLVGKLTGFYSLRVWPYRAIYLIAKGNKEVWVVHILHRQGAYK